jgi:hypothetical protein
MSNDFHSKRPASDSDVNVAPPSAATAGGCKTKRMRVSSESSRACEALSVVLQHLMTPNIGWSITTLGDHLNRLRREIVQHFVDQADHKDEEQVTEEIESKIQEEGARFGKNLDFMENPNISDLFMNISHNLPAPLSVSCHFIYLTNDRIIISKRT